MHFSASHRLAVGCLAAASLGALPAAAGATTGIFNVPAGDTVTLNEPILSGCDDLSYGYKLGSHPSVTLGEKPSGCSTMVFGNTTLGPFAGNVKLRLFLEDAFTAPPYTFWSNNLKHTTVGGSRGDWFIETGDSDFGTAPPNVRYHNSNFTTKVEFNL